MGSSIRRRGNRPVVGPTFPSPLFRRVPSQDFRRVDGDHSSYRRVFPLSVFEHTGVTPYDSESCLRGSPTDRSFVGSSVPFKVLQLTIYFEVR